MTPANKKLFDFFARWIVSKSPNEKGEWRMLCPIHGEEHPSATINFDKGLFHCNSSKCLGGMSVARLKRMVQEQQAEEIGVADYNPFESNVVDINARKAARNASADKETESKEKPLTEALVKSWHRGLMENKALREKFMVRRGLTMDTLVKYEIGIDLKHGRFIIPIRDKDGKLVNARKYKMDAEASQKMWNHLGLGSPPRLFPIAVLGEEHILLVEGELDALICNQNGVPAISGTAGAGRWDDTWSREFAGKVVYICYDNDKDGRLGAKKAAKSLRTWAKEVRIVPPPMEENKSDVSDFFLAGGTADQLRAAMQSAPSADKKEELPTETVSIEVIDSMDASTNGKPLNMTVSITGCKYPTYSLPNVAELSCTMDAGARCKVCPMMTDYEGDTTVNIDSTAIDSIARFVDTTEEQRVELLRKQIGAKKCDKLRATVTSSHTVNELFIATNVDRHNLGRSDYTQRRVYAIGSYPIDTNSVAHLVGTTHPNPRDSHNEFYAWDLKPATTSIDDFQMTPELAEQLKVFQTAKGQKPIQKCREIAEEISRSVTQIIGRERLHMCIDLVYHSVLNFFFDGKLMERGWLEFIVVGDTRTGKSKTATQLAEYYGLGHVVGCESATFAGLVGGVKQIGKDWTIQWGEITVNDRRLVVLDEVSGLSQEIISRMSDVRARGVAQVTAIETRTTKARTRLIWISNPRKPKFIDEKRTDGIDILEDLIGNPEDISRFDLAMSVRSEDISNDMINVPRPSSTTRYTKELCHALILWAWSRKPEHIVWEGTAHSDVFHAANWLGKLYVAHPPLVQGANAREKVARLAVALAARTFSTDPTGQQIIVTRQHVQDAMNFIHELCKYDNFGYYRRSKRIRRNQAIAKSKRDDIKLFLRENRRVFEFLLDRTGSFRAQDLEEMAFMHRDEVNSALGILSDAKMITKEKSQIVLEPELQEILKEMEKRK